MMPNPFVSRKLVGAHVSTAGTISSAVLNAAALGAKAFALDVRSKRRWRSKPMKVEEAEKFKQRCVEYGFSSHQILPHGSYLINLGSADEELSSRSLECLVEEMNRCAQLGITMYNVHPGSSVGKATVSETLTRIANSVQSALEQTKGVTLVLECTAGQGHSVGHDLQHFTDIFKTVTDHSRVGVCLDTCHLFASGHDLRTQEHVNDLLNEFDRVVGLKYLKAMHFNDSKAELGSRKDRHANIGKGKIGLECFRALMRDDRLNDIPLILETPCPKDDHGRATWKQEVDLLYELEQRSSPILSA